LTELNQELENAENRMDQNDMEMRRQIDAAAAKLDGYKTKLQESAA